MAPMRNPPLTTVMRECSGSILCKHTSRLGWNTPAFIISISAVPPATGRMVGSSGSSKDIASLSEVGSTISNGITYASPGTYIACQAASLLSTWSAIWARVPTQISGADIASSMIFS